MPVFDMTEDAFLTNDAMDVFSFGRPPSTIDVMVDVKGMDFDQCYQNSVYFEGVGLMIRTIYINDLIDAKKASNRAKDINDIEQLKNKPGRQ